MRISFICFLNYFLFTNFVSSLGAPFCYDVNLGHYIYYLIDMLILFLFMLLLSVFLLSFSLNFPTIFPGHFTCPNNPSKSVSYSRVMTFSINIFSSFSFYINQGPHICYLSLLSLQIGLILFMVFLIYIFSLCYVTSIGGLIPVTCCLFVYSMLIWLIVWIYLVSLSVGDE